MSDIPVTPDADTARQWAVDELSKQAYQPHEPSLYDRIVQWVQDMLSHINDFGARFSGGQVILILVVIALIVVGVVLLIVGPLRRSRRGARAHSVFEDDVRTASAMREASTAAAREGRWNAALLDRYRAVIRSLEERELLDERPGMTAHEAAILTGARFTDIASLARDVADLFDAVRYGDATATQGDYERAVDLDDRLAGRTILSGAMP